jgi:hydrogenase maturation protease
MTAPIIVFAIGNPSRGDDALGPLLLARLAEGLEEAGLSQQVELVEDFQLQIEHALDLEGRQLALFIDAGQKTAAPYRFYPIEPTQGIAHTTHALPPEAVLQVYCQTEGHAPPPAFVLCVRGEKFELGEPLTAEASTNLEAAYELLIRLCRQATLAEWKSAAGV